MKFSDPRNGYLLTLIPSRKLQEEQGDPFSRIFLSKYLYFLFPKISATKHFTTMSFPKIQKLKKFEEIAGHFDILD